MAAELPEHVAPGSEPSDRSAARWNTPLRFALTTGLRFRAHSNENTTTQKGDISNKLTMGTFLKSFDRPSANCLTTPCRRVFSCCSAEATLPVGECCPTEPVPSPKFSQARLCKFRSDRVQTA